MIVLNGSWPIAMNHFFWLKDPLIPLPPYTLYPYTHIPRRPMFRFIVFLLQFIAFNFNFSNFILFGNKS